MAQKGLEGAPELIKGFFLMFTTTQVVPDGRPALETSLTQLMHSGFATVKWLCTVQ